MSVLTREDGAQFITQSYRELLSGKGALALKAELRGLAQTNGRYARLYRHATGQLEAVFSTDPGYLLGETVWTYFNKPYNLFYCEVLDSDRYLVVIVKNRMIHLDAVMDQAALSEELNTLSADNIQYDVKIFGELAFELKEAQIRSFTQLENAVFAILPLLSQRQVLDIEQAIQAAKLGRGTSWLIAVAACVVLASTWLFWPAAPAVVIEKNGLTAEQQFQQALASPHPSEQLNETLQIVMQTLVIPGWQLQSISRSSSQTTAILRSTAGTTRELIDWAQSRGYNIQLTAKGAELRWRSRLANRPIAMQVTPSLDSLSQIIDQMMQVIPTKSVDIGSVKRHQLFKSTQLSIHFTQLSTDVFDIVARFLSGLPLALQVTTINVKNGLLIGTIKLTVIGN